MWQKKTEPQSKEELEKQKKFISTDRFNKAAKSSVMYFFLVFIFRTIYAVAVSQDYRRHDPTPSKSISLSELPQYLPEYLFAALFIAIIVFGYKFLTYNRLFADNSTLMCDQCFTTKNFDKKTICICGGTFSSLANFEWIEDDKPSNAVEQDWISKHRINKTKANSGLI
jgi:hypothetical protein